MATATLTPAVTPAAVAAKGKGKGTAPAAAAPAAPAAPTVQDFRDAVAAVDASGTYTAAAAATLASVTLARYRVHADRFTRTVDGQDILPESDRAEVAGMLWLEATGRIKSPAAKSRTAAETSIGQYIARFGTVATNMEYGTAWLSSPAVAGDAYKLISDAKSETVQGKQDREFTVWLSGLLPADSAAITRTLALMGPGGAGHESHRAAFARAYAPAK